MINKVNRPNALRLVCQSKAPENDPGGSQGSGLAYDGSQGFAQSEKKDDAKETPKSEAPTLSIVVSVEQLGMTEVVKDLLEHKMDAPPANAGLTTTRYSNDSSPAKGLLLNRKAE